MIDKKEIVRVGIILFVITAISALLLAFGNKITAPLIAENSKHKTMAAMQTILPEAEIFEMVEAEDESVVEAYVGKKSEKIEGVCIVAEKNGYGGTIQVMTGVNTNGEVTGIDILSHSETPGLGANAEKPEFKTQFIGKTNNIIVSRGDAEGNQINAMSGATITSKAVTEAVNTSLAQADIILAAAE